MKITSCFLLILMFCIIGCRETPPYHPETELKPYTFTVNGQIVSNCDRMEGVKRTFSFYKSDVLSPQLLVADVETNDEGLFSFTYQDTLKSPEEDREQNVFRPYYLRTLEDTVIFIFYGPGDYKDLRLVLEDTIEIDANIKIGQRQVRETESLGYAFVRYFPFTWTGIEGTQGMQLNGPLDKDTTISFPKRVWKVIEVGYDGIPFYGVYWSRHDGDTSNGSAEYRSISSKVSCVRRIDSVEIDWGE